MRHLSEERGVLGRHAGGDKGFVSTLSLKMTSYHTQEMRKRP